MLYDAENPKSITLLTDKKAGDFIQATVLATYREEYYERSDPAYNPLKEIHDEKKKRKHKRIEYNEEKSKEFFSFFLFSNNHLKRPGWMTSSAIDTRVKGRKKFLN